MFRNIFNLLVVEGSRPIRLTSIMAHECAHMHTSIYMITRCACVRTFVRPLPDVRRRGAASPLTSTSQKRAHYGHTVILQGRGGATIKGHDHSNSRVQARMATGRGDSG